MAFSVGQIVGDYQVIEILGSGGMGTVYKVRHVISDRLEAMKLVLPELTQNAELADRFMREIKVQARLSHPNIAALHNAFRMGDQLLMIMELVDGRTLHSIIRKGPMEPVHAVDLGGQVLRALEYAHSQGVIHRDIKPANIMIDATGRVKLMDFGIARSAMEENPLTQTGAAVGSIYYMSPEQVQGGPVDARSDLYSVGVLLYEMVTGVRPMTGDSSWAVMNAHINTIPRSPSSLNSRVPESLSAVIMRAMEKNPGNRFQNAQMFSASLMSGFGLPGTGAGLTEVAAPSYFARTPAPVPASSSVGIATPAPGTVQSSGSNTVQFDPEKLDKVTRELTLYVGPIAKVYVRRAVKKVQTWRQLYDALAVEIPEGPERRRFLSNRP